MTVLHKEVCASNSEAEIRTGYASWDKGMRNHISVNSRGLISEDMPAEVVRCL